MTQASLDFGNWIRIQRVFAFLALGSALLLVGFIGKDTYAIVIAIPGILLLLIAIYILYVYWQFSPMGGDFQQRLWRLTADHLSITGDTRVLDIGTGNGALAIMLAQTHPDIIVTGVDMWQSDWNYSRDQCLANAEIADVSARTQFEFASADSLPFPDSTFDAVISHFVFHEVKSLQDKSDAIREAIRVLKPGGRFSFHDMFLDAHYYSTKESFLRKLESIGISEHTFIETKLLIDIPMLLSSRRALGCGALIWGVR